MAPVVLDCCRSAAAGAGSSGGRSQQAAEEFRALGFSNVYNITGGINAWADDVDGTISKY